MKPVSIGVLLLVFATSARAADDFVDACMLSSGGGGEDQAKTCACMSTRIPADVRADAAEALRRSWKAMTDTSRPIDPSTLPPNLMKGLQATVVAQADCM
ncbi:MAG: hypothetical protein JSS04_03235 [Proteobacteria bacterium]|nr:hypothetical protein [Pseudomonadota bacterium]